MSSGPARCRPSRDWKRSPDGCAGFCPAGGIALRLDPVVAAARATRWRCPATGVVIAGGSAAGVFYGAQTLRQQLPPAALRRARISDEPLALPHIESDRKCLRGSGSLRSQFRNYPCLQASSTWCRQTATPNMSVNRTLHDMPPWPRGAVRTSSASWPGRHAVPGRLPLR